MAKATCSKLCAQVTPSCLCHTCLGRTTEEAFLLHTGKFTFAWVPSCDAGVAHGPWNVRSLQLGEGHLPTHLKHLLPRSRASVLPTASCQLTYGQPRYFAWDFGKFCSIQFLLNKFLTWAVNSCATTSSQADTFQQLDFWFLVLNHKQSGPATCQPLWGAGC